jgi:hypothetical protein
MGTTPRQDLTTQVAHVRDDLRREFGSLPSSVVDEHVHRQELALAGARIQAFVPVLVRRGARDELRQLVGH